MGGRLSPGAMQRACKTVSPAGSHSDTANKTISSIVASVLRLCRLKCNAKKTGCSGYYMNTIILRILCSLCTFHCTTYGAATMYKWILSEHFKDVLNYIRSMRNYFVRIHCEHSVNQYDSTYSCASWSFMIIFVSYRFACTSWWVYFLACARNAQFRAMSAFAVCPSQQLGHIVPIIRCIIMCWHRASCFSTLGGRITARTRVLDKIMRARCVYLLVQTDSLSVGRLLCCFFAHILQIYIFIVFTPHHLHMSGKQALVNLSSSRVRSSRPWTLRCV